MKHKLTTFIPVYNGERYLLQTLESVAKQAMRPDRLIVSDNRSTDKTEELVKNFKGMPVEWQQNPSNLGPGKNMNRGFEFAEETDYLQILHADDVLDPKFYETMVKTLEDCDGRGLAWCLDERIDENNQRLSVSGKTDGRIEVLERDRFLREKAEIGNQACSGTLLKANYQPAPCQFPLEFPLLGDMVFYPRWGMTCKKIVRVNSALVKYRWHQTNDTSSQAYNINSLVCQEWEVMKVVEALRGGEMSLYRKMKLKGLFAVRSGIKAKRIKAQGSTAYSDEIAKVAKGTSGLLFWWIARMLVDMRDVAVYGLMGRKKHPKNIFG